MTTFTQRHCVNTAKPPPAVSEPDVEFETLRQIFLARLPGEQQQLTIMATALARENFDASSMLDELCHRAHRLRGAAAIFEYIDLASAASKVEQAAALSATHATEADISTTAALATLVALLGRMNSQPRPADSPCPELSGGDLKIAPS